MAVYNHIDPGVCVSYIPVDIWLSCKKHPMDNIGKFFDHKFPMEQEGFLAERVG